MAHSIRTASLWLHGSGKHLLSSPARGQFKLTSRSLTSSEVSTALRPFYFLVHPDLFGLFPKEQAVNETSLKSVQSYLDTLLTSGSVPKSESVTFYLKQQQKDGKGHSSQRSKLERVSVKLKGREIRPTVISILKSANLPTSYVDSIESKQSSYKPPEFNEDDYAYPFDRHTQPEIKRPNDARLPLDGFLRLNVEKSRENFEKIEPRRLKLERIQDELTLDLGLKAIRWNPDLKPFNHNNCLTSLRSIVENDPSIKDIIKGKTIVFGNYSGLNIQGEIVLYVGEVAANWHHKITQIPRAQQILSNIPRVERALSHSLSGVKVVRKPFQVVANVEDYRRRLRQLMTSINDYRSTNRFPPENWPKSLENLEICLEDDCGSLMVTPTGQIIVPSNIAIFRLNEFFSDPEVIESALSRLSEAEAIAKEEAEIMSECTATLGLVKLEKTIGIHSKAMTECCTRLLQYSSQILHLTHGAHLLVDRYYSLESDGTLVIPFNWKEDRES